MDTTVLLSLFISMLCGSVELRYISVVGSRPSSIVDARPVCDEDDDVVSQCGGHGTCDRGQCRCNPYYAGPTCDECFACDDSRFRNVWSCVECEFASEESDLRQCRHLVDSGACNVYRSRLVFSNQPKYNLVHHLQQGLCRVSYGVDVKSLYRRATVYMYVDCSNDNLIDV